MHASRSRSVRVVFSTALVAAAFVHSASASADEISPLEEPGTVALGFGALVGQSHGQQVYSPDGVTTSTASIDVTQITGGVRAEIFLTPVVTVGGGVDVGWTHISANGDGIGHSFFVSPTGRLGVYAPISDHVGFWPYVYGGVTRVDAGVGDAGNAYAFGGSVRFVLRFDDRWFLAAEPIQVGYTTSSGTSTLGPTGPMFRSGLSLGVVL